MSGYVLTYRTSQCPALVDGSLLRPDTLAELDTAALGAVMLPVGRTQVALRDLFEIQGEAGPRLTIRNTPPLDRLGAKMSHGELIVEGDAGDDLGASMTGGLIRVHGNAGHRAGGPDVTSHRGMNGGEMIIEGSAGDFAGFLMRRGLLVIAGITARSPGYRMLAGTIVLLSRCKDHAGLEMQRGTIICLDECAGHSHLSEGGTVALGAMPAMLLVIQRLRSLGVAGKAGASIDRAGIASSRLRIWTGDRLNQNKGEVLQWLP